MQHSLRHVFMAWFPLALSFELMMMEAPSLQAAVGRLADPRLNLAAWGLTISLSLLIESPVIMLLPTSIALSRSRPAFDTLRRFVLRLCVACTALTAALAFTPLYARVTGAIMRQPADIAEAARPALGIMLLWTGAIGYRRFYQGLLVRARQANRVSWGTGVRLVTVLATAVFLVRHGQMPGVQVAATAIMVGVISEAFVTRLFAREAVRDLGADDADEAPLTTRDVVRFHTPLAATSLLTLLAPPITAAAVAWLPNAVDTLAAWPVAFGVMLVIRGGGLALQEASVACAHDARARAPLHRFAWVVGVLTSAVAALLALTPLLDLYLGAALQVPLQLHPLVRRSTAICVALPLFTALSSHLRGLLMIEKDTGGVYAGMGVGLVTQCAVLVLGVFLNIAGIDVAGFGLMSAAICEWLYLRSRIRRSASLA